MTPTACTRRLSVRFALPVALLTMLTACSGEDPVSVSPANAPAIAPGPSTASAIASSHAPTLPDPAPGPESPTFVGRERCLECHPGEHARWVGSHHDLAMQDVDESTVLGDFDDASLEHFGQITTFFRADDRFMVRTAGPTGALEDYELAYTFGATPLQQYLIAFPGGRYQPLNVAWDARPEASGGQRWFHLFPDEAIPYDDELHWTGRIQNWNFTCAECHSTDLRRGYQADTDSYATTWAEIDVSCEACHGPASAHVEWADSQAPAVDGDVGLIVQLGDTGGGEWLYADGENTMHRTAPRTDRQVEMCAQCHSRRQALLDVHEYGEPFLDTHRLNLLEERLYEADGQIKDEVFVYGSFLQSKMHGAGVACSDCHDPHGGDVLIDGNALCAQCHSAEVFDSPEHHHHETGTPGARCVECHMPAKDYMVVDPRRDHSLRIPRPDLTDAIGSPNACNGCHAEQPASWAAAAVREWGGEPERHYGETFHAARNGEAGAGLALAALASDVEAPGIVRATALTMLSSYWSDAAPATIVLCLEDDDPLVRVGAVAALEAIDPRERPGLATPLLSDPVRTVRIEAARVLAATPGNMLDSAARTAFEAALREVVESELASAGQPHAHHNLGLVLGDMGQMQAAIAAYERALELDPSFVRSAVNLADVYRALEQDELGERVLRDALATGRATSPAGGDLHHALGMLLIRGKRLPDALTHLESAASLRPDLPRYAVAHGLALQASGDDVGAFAVLREASARHPRDSDLLYVLATVSRDLGETQTALDAARTLVLHHPDDPGLRAFLAELESGAGR